MSALLDVAGLTMRFGGLTAVDDVSFAVERGSIVSLIGPNGAGKTTVFNAITAIYRPTAGSVRFLDRPLRRRLDNGDILRIGALSLGAGLICALAWDAEELWRAAVTGLNAPGQPFPWLRAAEIAARRVVGDGAWAFVAGAAIGAAAQWRAAQASERTPDLAHRRGIARTFQNIRLFREMSCIENVLVGMDARCAYGPFAAALRLPSCRASERERCRRAHELLAFVNLGAVADRPSGSLPYGSQRRLEIARALASDPQLLLLDEPAAGMNESESAALMDLIRAIRDRGVTVLLIEHDMNVVMGISERVIVLDHGVKIAEGTPAEVRADPAVIEAYLGKDG